MWDSRLSHTWVEIETIRSVIEAYGNGEIELAKVPKNTPPAHIRELSQAAGIVQFTKLTVAKFLGWTRKDGKEANNACDAAFAAMDMIDEPVGGLKTFYPRQWQNHARARGAGVPGQVSTVHTCELVFSAS